MNGKYLLDTNAIINLLKDENANLIVNHLTLVTDDDRLFNIEGLNVIHLSDLIYRFITIASNSVE